MLSIFIYFILYPQLIVKGIWSSSRRRSGKDDEGERRNSSRESTIISLFHPSYITARHVNVTLLPLLSSRGCC